MKPFRIIFMGTPDFAVPALTALHQSGQELALVVTQPDRPKGRGRKMQPPPVKRVAEELGIEVAQPATVKSEGFISRIETLSADLMVVAAFGQILPGRLLAVPPLGAVNVHASLLPKYRGAAPIQWAVINGETETGVTIMAMDARMDTGDILLASPMEISAEDTAGTLHDKLASLGADSLLKALTGLADGTIKGVAQDHSRASYAPMLKKEDGRIDWRRSAAQLDAFVRGMNPWPGAFTFHGDRRIKILSAGVLPATVDAPPGTVVAGFPDELRVAAGSGVLTLFTIQQPGSRPMAVKDFLRGNPFEVGTRFR